MDGRSEFFVYMGTAIGTTVFLFLAQQVYASYLDVSLHAEWNDAPRDAKIVEKRAAEQGALSSGKLPIDKAIELLAQRGRGASNAIAPAQSSDVSAMSGWAYRHGFTAYTPRTTAPPPAPVETAPAEGDAAPAQPAEDQPTAQPVENTAPPAAAQPAQPADAAHAPH